MGIKSTTTLTRSQALEMYHQLQVKLGLQAEMTNEQLGNLLDLLREAECQLEDTACFDNYIVVND